MSKSVTIGMPVIVGTILSLLGGGIVVAAQVIPGVSTQVQSGVTVGMVFFLGIGITPLVGHQFYAALQLPPWAANLASAVMAAVTLASTTIHMPGLAHKIVAAFLAVATGLGFEPATPNVPQPVIDPVAVTEPIKPRAPEDGPMEPLSRPARGTPLASGALSDPLSPIRPAFSEGGLVEQAGHVPAAPNYTATEQEPFSD